MFKGKVYMYKNLDGKEVKVEKEFDDEKKFNKYVNSNAELQKLQNSWKDLEIPKSFSDMKKFFDDFDLKVFADKKDSFFDDISEDFTKLLDKSKKLLGK